MDVASVVSYIDNKKCIHTERERKREINSDYFAWEEVPVGQNPCRDDHRIIPVTVVTEVIAGVVTQPRLT